MSPSSAPAAISEIAALHQAARRYCVEQHARWVTLYRSQRKNGLAEDYNLFPRYIVLGGILEEIERWVPEDFATLAEARELLAEVARTGSCEVSRKMKHPIGLAAQAEVRAAAVTFLYESSLADWLAVEPLPFAGASPGQRSTSCAPLSRGGGALGLSRGGLGDRGGGGQTDRGYPQVVEAVSALHGMTPRRRPN